MLDEGYIKFQLDWQQDAPLPDDILVDLQATRIRLYAQRLVGYNAQLKVGYGNISQRLPAPYPGHFVITGTRTGAIAALTPAHYTTVTDYNLAQNTLQCVGPIRASSESLTHAAVYALSDAYGAVIHVHHLGMWRRMLGQLPTTPIDIPYGTPEMAQAVADLYQAGALTDSRFLVMGGHEEGLLAFGGNLSDAYDALMHQIKRFGGLEE